MSSSPTEDRLLAIARLYLDNFRHLHSGWVTEGAKLAQVALDFGADAFSRAGCRRLSRRQRDCPLSCRLARPG